MACRRNQDVSVLRRLMAFGADVNGFSRDMQDTPLTVAVRCRYDPAIEFLLTCPGIDVDRSVDPYGSSATSGFTPLMLSAVTGYKFGVTKLLNAGADRSLCNSLGQTARILALGADQLAVADLLAADPDVFSVYDCVVNNNIALLVLLLAQNKANVNEPVAVHGGTALHYAVSEGKTKVVEILSQCSRVDVNATDGSGATPLILCAKTDKIMSEKNRVAIALHLLRAGARRDMQDNYRRCAYEWASGFGEKSYPMLANLLLYDPQACNICDLARARNADGVRALLLQGADVNEMNETDGYTALIAAVYNSDYCMCQYIVSYGGSALNIDLADPNSFMTPLHYAAQVGDVRITALLLQNGANRDVMSRTGWTPLQIAQYKRHRVVCDCLQFNPDSVSISLAAKHGDWRVMSALLLQGVSINELKCHTRDGVRRLELDHALIAAAAFGKTDLVKTMFRFCRSLLNVNIANTVGQTALMYAAACGVEDLVLELLSNGCDRYKIASDGTTALDWARRYKQTKIADILHYDPTKFIIHDLIAIGKLDGSVALFKQGIDPNTKWDGSRMDAAARSISVRNIAIGDTPLIVAARANQISILTLLLRAPGVDINAADASGWTPLFHAAYNGHEQCVLFLLQHGSNRRALDYTHQRASDHAMRNDKVHLAFLIEADPNKVSIHDTCAAGKVNVYTNYVLKCSDCLCACID